ncbi:SUMF1/EgtB/PvdO family nonheme iron enzyme [Streptomyces sp. NBC_01408]|uniref:SUMF1/EgtB/PvdO family nonheme iron enzyme n=1 Tax=Streptomyces sp. NBC_01408 TaxID=2903855 RepID=UPI00225BD50D|nr:SUMF1/EgtB/PvdO family nonheme iron enzyme [Streptomyces sp. NBC_01408]MCX4692773.1 formylglycine-generating enzyme family protein [Streptomyces sp. NBC_01408]
MQALVQRAPQHSEVRDVVAWLTHDYEDFVAFSALDLAGRLRLTSALPDLFVIVGRASQRLSHKAGKPVGIGHAVALRAISAIVGSSDREDLVRVEGELFPDGDDLNTYPPQPPRDADTDGAHDHSGMVRVPGGRVPHGPPAAFDRGSLVFDWDEDPEHQPCDDFHMDVLPVSNAEYDAFAVSPAATQHLYCHPSEAKDKVHLRNTLLDLRSGPDHPVAGVDWFDAYAYARSRGKRLPSEAEWQRAAQGDDGRAYPWGDAFDPARTHGSSFRAEPGWAGVEAWRGHLLEMADTPPTATTVGRGIPGSESPYGVKDMSGNVWEWTQTSFDGPVFSPLSSDRDAIDVIYDQRSYVVIKGGTWSSLPEQLSVAFRGRDLALDRHFEIGFRCVCTCAPSTDSL